MILLVRSEQKVLRIRGPAQRELSGGKADVVWRHGELTSRARAQPVLMPSNLAEPYETSYSTVTPTCTQYLAQLVTSATGVPMYRRRVNDCCRSRRRVLSCSGHDVVSDVAYQRAIK
jgi:hypothetical protein